MSAVAETIDSVVVAIGEEIQRGPDVLRLRGLSAVLDSLHAVEFARLTGGAPKDAAPAHDGTPQVVASKPGYVAWLNDHLRGTVVLSRKDFTVWQRDAAGWSTPGSDAVWSAEDLSVRGPFIRMVPVQ